MEIRLNSSLDANQLAEEFAKARRIQIRDILELEAAERLYQCLTNETPWLTAYRDGGQDHMIPEERLRAMAPQEVQALQQKVWQQAPDEFEFMYSSYPLMDERLKAENPDLFLYQWIDYINSEEVLAFIRKVTGQRGLIRADGQGTW